jgi:hypothetical protein
MPPAKSIRQYGIFCLLLIVVTTILYIPALVYFGAARWLWFGPIGARRGLDPPRLLALVMGW